MTLSTKLQKFIHDQIDQAYLLRSREHPLNTQLGKETHLFIKRDDELSFGISGCKYRKYSSLIPYLKKTGSKKVLIEGSCNSNHLVSMMQILNEEQIDATLLTTTPHTSQGNYKLLKMLAKDKRWIQLSKEQWKNRAMHIKGLLKENTKYITEGADMFESLPGMMTLSLDLKNEYDHIFVDAGTGHAAIALILSLKALGMNTKVHVALMAGGIDAFKSKLAKYKKKLESALKKSVPLSSFKVYKPQSCQSFGATSQTIFDVIQSFAADEGIFLDPIYSAKLWILTKQIIKEEKLSGNALMIHSGGALTLCGFMDRLDD